MVDAVRFTMAASSGVSCVNSTYGTRSNEAGELALRMTVLGESKLARGIERVSDEMGRRWPMRYSSRCHL